MADDGDDPVGRAMMLAGGDRYRDPVRDVVEGDEVNPHYAEVRPAQGPIQSPLGWNEPLANRLPSGAMDVLAGLIGPRAPVRVPNPIKAYHGSPHDFDAFDLSKIGTGEGAQAYGHGLYFAEREGVARSYRDALARSVQDAPFRLLDNVALSRPKDLAGQRAFDALKTEGGNVDAAIARVSKDSLNPERRDAALQALERWKANNVRNYEPSGKMYEVALHASPEQFLDWDKPLSGQSEAARAAFEDLYRNAANKAGYRIPLNPANPMEAHVRSLEGAMGAMRDRHAGAAAASDALREAGIPGIRYLDQGSRVDPHELATWRQAVDYHTKTGDSQKLAVAQQRLADLERRANNGTSNYVVWSPEIIEILRKYGVLGPGILAAMGGLTNNKTEQ